jgi:hypothetical protein
MTADRRPLPRAFSREYTWDELKTADMMPAYCKLHYALLDFDMGALDEIIDSDDPLRKAVCELQRMVVQRLANTVAVSIPGLLKQMKLFGLRTECGIYDEPNDRSDVDLIRSIRAGIEAITEGKRG